MSERNASCKLLGMSDATKYLLSTRPLPKAVVDDAAAKGVIIETLSFISTAAIQDEALFQKIRNLATQPRTVVFTSMNAVEAVAEQINAPPAWRIYSIGNTTRKLIEAKWGADKLVATAENASRLGERLIDDGVDDVLFFCGNIRRDELPNKIRSEGGRVEEVVVYQTEETPAKLEQEYDGVLFFSPSAVQSFFSANKLPKQTVCFAIGRTTADAIREHSQNKIIIGTESSKEELVYRAVEYFNS